MWTGNALEALVVIPWAWAALALVVNLLLALTVFGDARTERNPALGISPVLWLWVVLFSSVLGVVSYWLMNRSTLASQK